MIIFSTSVSRLVINFQTFIVGFVASNFRLIGFIRQDLIAG